MRSSIPCSLVIAATLTAGCSSSSSVSTIDYSDSRRFLGREGDVRIDAQLSADRFGNHATVHLRYQIHNMRGTPIALETAAASSSYDPETRTITVMLGSEIPGRENVRLAAIASGETKSFHSTARLAVAIPALGPAARHPRFVRLRVNFLGDVKPFETLLGGAARGVDDALFPHWVEHNESITTNTLPIDWEGAGAPAFDASRRAGLADASRGGGNF